MSVYRVLSPAALLVPVMSNANKMEWQPLPFAAGENAKQYNYFGRVVFFFSVSSKTMNHPSFSLGSSKSSTKLFHVKIHTYILSENLKLPNGVQPVSE